MPKKYDAETRAKAVRLVCDHVGDYTSEYEAIRTVAGRLGMNPETLRKWIRQAEVDQGQGEGTTTAAAREIRELKRKNAELEQTIEILKAGGCRTNQVPRHGVSSPSDEGLVGRIVVWPTISWRWIASSCC